MSGSVLILLKDIKKSYREGGRERLVLHHLDLRIEVGEFVAVLGRSGSGKTSLLHILSGIDTPDSGSVIIQGRDLAILPDRERTLFRRRRVGFVFQFFNLIPTLSVEENLRLPLELNDQYGPDAQARVLRLLDEIELRERRGSFPDRLSGGEQQRVAIARALTHDPLLLLADEPTGNLDQETGCRVMDLISHLHKNLGMTVVTATHSVEMAARADRTLQLKDGRLEPR